MRFLRRLRRRRVTTLNSRDAYALWAAEYPPRPHNPLMRAEEDAMRELLPAVDGQRVLDLAGGTGRYGHLLARAGGHVLCVDDSPAMLRANSLPHRVQASMLRLPLADGVLRGIVCGLAVGHIWHLAAFYAECARLLAPEGFLLLSDLHPALMGQGAQRTFSLEDRLYGVRHHTHALEAHHRAAEKVGLQGEAIREPTLPDGETPMVLVLRWRKAP